MSTALAPPDDPVLERLHALGRALAQASDPTTARRLLREAGAVADAPPPDGADDPAPALGPIGRRPAQLARLARRHTLGALVSALTHELSQPLSAIGMYSNAAVFLIQGGGLDAEELTRVMSQIETQVKRAGEMLTRVRTLARQGVEETRGADLCQSVADALALVRPLAADKQVSLHWERPPEPLWVAADRAQVTQVLLNLLFNGIEAIAPAASTQRRVSVTVHPEPAWVQITVHDTGPGIDPAAARRIFDGLESDKPAGCGLGLAICRSLIAHLGGQLWADRPETAGEATGAALHLRLPVSPPPRRSLTPLMEMRSPTDAPAAWGH